MVYNMGRQINSLIYLAEEENKELLLTFDSNTEYISLTCKVNDYLRGYILDFNFDQGTAFMLFLSQFRVSIIQALLSFLRLHSIQGFMMLRHSLEAAALGCYALHENNPNSFYSDEYKELKKFNNDAYKWIQNELPSYSDHLKYKKSLINRIFAHTRITSMSPARLKWATFGQVQNGPKFFVILVLLK